MSALARAPEHKKLVRARRGLVVFSALYIFLFAAAFFGWGPMQLLLEKDGAFSFKCDVNDPVGFDGEADVCAGQTKSLLNVQLVAQLTLVLSPAMGHACDKFGAHVMILFMAASSCAGIALLMVASASGIDQLLFVAFPLMGLMAVCACVVLVQTGLVFDGEDAQRRVISCLNSLFDAGSITYLGLWAIGDRMTASNFLVILMGGYLVLAVVCFGGAAYFWRRVFTLSESQTPVNVDSVDDEDSSSQSVAASSAPEIESQSTSSTTIATGTLSCPERLSEHNTVAVDANGVPNDTRPGDGDPSRRNPGYSLISLRRSSEQLKSSQFVTLCVFFAFHTSRNIFTVTTARSFLAYLGDNETGNKYLTIFTLLMPASLLGLPLVDRVLCRHGYHIGLQSINALALAHGTIQVSSNNLNVQVFGFCVFSFYSCFLYSVSFSFLPVFLSEKVIGKATGLLVCFAGIFSFINIPLANLAVSKFGGNFFWPNLFYTVLVLPCIYAAWRMGRGIKKEKAAAAAAAAARAVNPLMIR